MDFSFALYRLYRDIVLYSRNLDILSLMISTADFNLIVTKNFTES